MPAERYEAPSVEVLGRLVDVTLGSGTSCDDGSQFSPGEQVGPSCI